MADKIQIPVDVSVEDGRVVVELNPEDLIELRPDEEINTVSITLAGEEIARLQRFPGFPPGTNTSQLNLWPRPRGPLLG